MKKISPFNEILHKYVERRKQLPEKTFVFKNFSEAFAFMTRVGMIAEKMNHHPDWRNMYNRVEISFSTHDAGSTVTEKDRQLAKAIDGIAG